MTQKLELRFLTEDADLIALCQRYWTMDAEGQFVHRVSDMAKERQLSTRALSELVATNCQALSTAWGCVYCDTPYVFSNRQRWINRSNDPWECANCAKKRRAADSRAEETKDTHRRRVIQQRYGSIARGPIDIASLSLENAVFLLGFFRGAATEDLSYAASLDSLNPDEPLTPTDELNLELVRSLHAARLIFVHPGSPLAAFAVEEADTFYTRQVFWLLPFGLRSDKPRDFLDDLEETFRTWERPSQWFEGELALWRKVALHDCLQYLKAKLNEHNLEYKFADKTFSVISNLLLELSVSQIYSFIWRATKDAAAFYMRGGVTKLHAANTVVGSIQRQSERAKAEGWAVRSYGRDFGAPQSTLSQVLYDVAFKIGAKGFTAVPSQAVLDFADVPDSGGTPAAVSGTSA